MIAEPFDCFLVSEDAPGAVRAGSGQATLDELPAGDVLIEVAWSSLNYKRAGGPWPSRRRGPAAARTGH